MERTSRRLSRADLLLGVATIGLVFLQLFPTVQAEENKERPLKCKEDEGIVTASGYAGLAEGETAKDALKKFLDETYPEIPEEDFYEEPEGKDVKEKKLTKKDEKAAAYAIDEGDKVVLEGFATCQSLIVEEG